jgi:hypothetical protein
MLGYSYQVTEKHAARAGGTYATYANLVGEKRTDRN